MLGIVKKLVDAKGFGFISVKDLDKDLFFHSSSLVGITYDELQEGDSVNFETELIPRKYASSDTIQNSQRLLPYAEQKIVTPSSPEDIKLQKKITADIIVRLSQNPTDLFRLSAEEFEELIAELYVIHGYTIEMLGTWNQADGGVDILAIKCDIGTHRLRWAIQCKRYAPSNLVSAAPIRALERFSHQSGATVYPLCWNHPRASRGETASIASPTAASRVSRVRAARERRNSLTLLQHGSIGFHSGV